MKKTVYFILILFGISQIIFSQSNNKINISKSYSTTPWSVRMVESEMSRQPIYLNSWGYVEGTFLKSVEELWRTTSDNKYFQYIRNSLDAGFKSDGGLKSYNYSDYSLDEICEGRILLLMYKEGLNEIKYQNAIDTLRSQLRHQPRTYDGGFWHRNNSNGQYPHQMWLDGIYMANPFYAEYGLLFNEPEDFDDVLKQITVMEKHARDSVTGLLYHGWDELHTQSWANLVTGCSPSFWGRADGWYAMAVVDILDYLPQNYSGRDTAIAIIQRLAEALKKVQDPVSGVWWQVLDKGDSTGNYLESSCSCMFVYALAKSIRLGYIDKSYWDVVKKGYAGILNQFITINKDSTINLIQTCLTAGLGGNPYRSGTYDYYVYQTSKSINDGKATGPFIMASLEVENSGLVVPPLSLSAKLSGTDKVVLTWKDMSFNAKSFVIERKRENENNFLEIGNVHKGIASYVDSTIDGISSYYYRAKAVSDSSASGYSNIDSVNTNPLDINEEKLNNLDFRLFQNYPNPFNPETKIEFSLTEAGKIKLSIYDVLGNKITTLINKYLTSGLHSINFNASNLSSGVYFYRIEVHSDKLNTNEHEITKKMILLR